MGYYGNTKQGSLHLDFTAITNAFRAAVDELLDRPQKYRLMENDTIKVKEFGWWGDDRTLYRVAALVDIPRHGVKAGDLGGYVESEKSLSHYGDAWVGGNARVFKDARVKDNALVTDDAELKQKAKALENVVISGTSELSQWSVATGNAQVAGASKMSWHSRADGNACLNGASLLMHTHVTGDTVIFGEAPLSETDKKDMTKRMAEDPVYRRIAKGTLGAPR